MTATLRQAAGSLLVVGLGGTELSGLERAWLKLVRPAGVILFRRNIADCATDAALLEDATALCTAQQLSLRGCGGWHGGPAARRACADAVGTGRRAGCAAHRETGTGARAWGVDWAKRKGFRVQYHAGAGVGSGLWQTPRR